MQEDETPSDKVADVADRVADMIGLKGAMTRRLLNDLVDKGLWNKVTQTNRRRYLKVPLDK
jgi:hypothetical protein